MTTNLTAKQNLRYDLLKATNYDVCNAKKCYDFINGNEPENQPAADNATTLADGIYLKQEDGTVVRYTGQELTKAEKDFCTGIGVKFGDKSLVLALNDINDDGRELTTEDGGTRFITSYHQAAEDMDGMEATNDIRDILNMGIADEEYIPSLGELYFILAHFSQINAALKAVGGEPLRNDWYWSSTQYSATTAWYLYLNYGNASYYTKATYQLRVRPVSAFLPLNS